MTSDSLWGVVDGLHHVWETYTIDQWINFVELTYIGIFFVLKAFFLIRKTSFGWAMSTNNLMTGAVFIGSVVLTVWDGDGAEKWVTNALRIGLGVTVTWALFELLRPPPPHSVEMSRLENKPSDHA